MWYLQRLERFSIDWLTKLAPLSQPMGIQTKTNRVLAARVFPRLAPVTCTPFAVHLRKIYIHLRQQLKLYGKYTFISTSMNFVNANELSITLIAYVLTFNSING